MDEQPRLTDLVPTRLSVLLLLFVFGLAVAAGLEALYAWMPRVARLTTDGRVAALDLDGEGSLAVWFSSMTLAVAGLVAILVFAVRRHRRDDYSGRYRVWLWAAACCFLLSLDETSSLHEGFKEMMTCVTGTRLYGDGSIWWVIAYFFLLAGVGIRLLLDMRECKLSSASIVAAAGCYVAAVAAQLGWILPQSGARGVMLEEGAEMVGNLLLLLAMALHARHVILDAEGRVATRAANRSEPAAEDRGLQADVDGQSEGDSEEDEGKAEPRVLPAPRKVRVHPPHGVSRPAGARSTSSQETVGAESASSETEGLVRRKLTKTEKKAMRKKLRQMARKRQAQDA
jgi:hypothetical protein